MNRLIQSLRWSVALSLGCLVGGDWLLGQEKVQPPPGVTPSTTLPPGRGYIPAGKGDSKADPDAPAVKVTDNIVKTEFAVQPRELSVTVKKGLKYLVDNQQKDGGWNQGGGWRHGGNTGGRVEGADDPSDVGNTCFAVLALMRAGNTVTEGEYKDAVAKGLKFVIDMVEKTKSDSLFVTDIRNTQLQTKIGQYVDTFLVNLTLAEARGKAGNQEKALVAALEKTMNKIVKHQTADGGFAGNNGWAPTLSLGLCNKGITRARERGAVVDEVVLKRAFAQSQAAANGTAPPEVASGPAGASTAGRPATASTAAGRTEVASKPPVTTGATAPDAPAPLAATRRLVGAAGDAGVALYGQSQGAGNTQDIVNSLRLDAEEAKKVLQDAKASKGDKDKAQEKLNEFTKADIANDALQANLGKNLRNQQFVAGFGNNGGEEFLSFMNISETLVLRGGKDWEDWNTKMITGLEKAQDQNGSWSGQHCITGKTFCTSAALLVLMADRTPFPADVIKGAREKKETPAPAKPNEK